MFDHVQVEIVCPNCSNKIQQPFGWFKKQKPSCPVCSAFFDTTEARGAIKYLEKEYQKAMKEIARTLKIRS